MSKYGRIVRELLAQLKQAGLTPRKISEELDGRVSKRTIYRWQKGDSEPQQKSDIDALRALAARILPEEKPSDVIL